MALRFTGTRDHTTARKGPYIVPQFLQKKRTGVYRKKGHGDVEGKDDGGAMADERKLEGVDGVVLVIVAATSLAWSCWSGC
jgi:hypothetical protein